MQAAERLARTREAILAAATGEADETPGDTGPDPKAPPWIRAREAVHRWWQQHPAHQVARLAAPLARAWTRRHPGRLLALAAAGGAVLVLARPWRLVSVTGLLVATLRSPSLIHLLMSALSPQRDRPRGFPPPERRTP